MCKDNADKNCYVYLEVKTDSYIREDEIKEMIRSNGGSIDNLSIINDEIGKRHPNFELKSYGYSRISSFLRRIIGLEVNNNSVLLKDKENQ